MTPVTAMHARAGLGVVAEGFLSVLVPTRAQESLTNMTDALQQTC